MEVDLALTEEAEVGELQGAFGGRVALYELLQKPVINLARTSLPIWDEKPHFIAVRMFFLTVIRFNPFSNTSYSFHNVSTFSSGICTARW